MSRQKPGEASATPTRVGIGRWSAQRKVSVVLELLRGADLESVSCRHGVTAGDCRRGVTSLSPAATRNSKRRASVKSRVGSIAFNRVPIYW